MISMIWAQTRNGIIGADGDMPWNLPEDLQHFSRTTRDGAVIMGRRTWDSFPDRFRPLPQRLNVVLTRDAARGKAITAQHPEVVVTGDLDTALEASLGHEQWVIGGASIYREALPRATRAVVTLIDVDVSGDTRAPKLDSSWRIARRGPVRLSRLGMFFQIWDYRR